MFTLVKEHILLKKTVSKVQCTLVNNNNNIVVNKQINDKERITAAMENPNLKEIVEECIKERDY